MGLLVKKSKNERKLKIIFFRGNTAHLFSGLLLLLFRHKKTISGVKIRNGVFINNHDENDNVDENMSFEQKTTR